MKTIIAEKPSVAREIARIVGATKREDGYFEGSGYAVTWAFGHLVQLAMPDGYGIRGFVRDNLPVIPDTFTLIPRQVKTEKGYKPDSSVVAQIKTITRLFNQSNQIIVATDAGREGELIFRYLYHYIGCTTPFVRLWINSLTDKAIREGLRNLEAGSKYDNLYLAAKARSESDWLVGINGTQALSIAAGHGTYSAGRVQTPTLAMVCARYWENRRFTVEPFWQLHFAADAGGGDTVKFSSTEKWKAKEPATELYNKIKEAGTATVTKAERKEKIEDTPLLYDLTTLQKDANSKHGFTAEQTLEIVAPSHCPFLICSHTLKTLFAYRLWLWQTGIIAESTKLMLLHLSNTASFIKNIRWKNARGMSSRNRLYDTAVGKSFVRWLLI